ncbi:MAG TPA: acyl-CoA dehydrogenase family protein [Pseudonocardiaceae bacterium]|nr:acyl-CoA dehydrogenase family protein [Pseudonocardiaceae bacterium]
MESIYLTEQHQRFRLEVRDFLAEAVVPFAPGWEARRRLPREAWKSFGERGLLGLLHSRDVGGSAQDLFSSVVFLEELGRIGYGGLRAAVSVHAYMATYYLARSGNAALRQHYLAPAVAGDKIAALAVTEPGAGSDLAGLTSTVHEQADHFVLHGTKSMVSNGSSADFYVVLARSGARSGVASGGGRGAAGLSLFVVDADRPGITIDRTEPVGWRGADPATLCFEAVRVPLDQVVGRLNSGFYQLMRGFQLERVVAAVLALGGADRSLQLTREHLVSRSAFGARLADLQAIRHQVADLATNLAAARELVYHAVWRYQSDDLGSVRECSMAKLCATELATRMADTCLQLHGAHGYLDNTEVARAFRDARAATIAAGPSEVMRDIIARLEIDEATNSTA